MQSHADYFKALGDVTRLEILMMLKEGDKSTNQIVERFHLKQPTISHHMKVLHQTGLIRVRKQGKWRIHTLNIGQIAHASHFINSCFLK